MSRLARALALAALLAGCAGARPAPARRAVLPFGAFHNDQGMLICPTCGRGTYTCTKAKPDAHIDSVHLDYACVCGEEWSTATLSTVPTIEQLSAWIADQQMQANQSKHDAELAAKVKAETLSELAKMPPPPPAPKPARPAAPKLKTLPYAPPSTLTRSGSGKS